ncbi:MAG TPA: GDSL-type esterase/lipase family protein [Phycisphaerae bacterium]|nr:GDSL-type esterase/lipase family protein [Phycisphaerae bacterium]HRY68533.1 GDSL-type esterase/lipase family protein [Phycisphaerae bacterium]HSA25581.1 GDSL-type esterase/lipase family protein [Phycisphaerae bacterium]
MSTTIRPIPEPRLTAAILVVAVLTAAAGMRGEVGRPSSAPASAPAAGGAKALTPVPMDDTRLLLAPYAWKRTGAGRGARVEAGMPGAYVKAAFRGSAVVGLLVDGTANDGCPPTAMPVIDVSLDFGEFKSVQLARTGMVYALPLADGLDATREHRLEVHFRSAGLSPDRWRASTVHLRLAGLELDTGGSLVFCPPRSRRAIGFGDSITEGVCSEGLCSYYSNLLMHNARVTWFPLVCAALDCEYGQLGTGGQGMVRTLEIPPLPQTWDRYDPGTSRLADGLLTPEPDYVFCAMGTNDHQKEGSSLTLLPIKDAYARWLVAMRKACPHAAVFCVVPPLGWHAETIAEVVADRNRSGDQRVFLIDTVLLRDRFSARGATQLAPDGVHPSVYGNAMLGALIAGEVQRATEPLRTIKR